MSFLLHLENVPPASFRIWGVVGHQSPADVAEDCVGLYPPDYFNNSVPNGTEPPLQIRDKTTRPSVTAISWSRYAFSPRRSLTGPSLHPRHPRKEAKIHSHFDRDATRNGPTFRLRDGEMIGEEETAGCRRGAARIYL